MKTEILRLLRQSNDYISGQELCEKFGVSRTAVWKAVNTLKDEGYVIEAVKNKGYKIVEYPDIITFNELSTIINTKWAGNRIYYFDQIDSTNNKAKQLAEEGAPNGTLVVTDVQTSGKGRRGRSWESPSGTGVWMSMVLKPDMEITKASMITLVMALAVAKACKEYTDLECLIKWPNDIVVNGKKICGILTELSIEMEQISYIIIGVGINVNTKEFPKDLEAKATSLLNECGHNVKRAMLIEKIMNHFEEELEIFLESQSLKAQMEEYNNLLVNINKEVVVLERDNGFEGIARGINENGELVVTKKSGENINVYAGEVSVRGINGYV